MPHIETPLFYNEVQLATKTVTFDGTTGKGFFNGNFGTDYALLFSTPAAVGTRGLGLIVLRVDIVVLSSLVGAAGTTLSFIGQGYEFDAATDISTLTTGRIWTAGAATTGAVAMAASSKEIVTQANDGQFGAVPDVHSVTGGSIRCNLYYLPLGAGAVVV